SKGAELFSRYFFGVMNVYNRYGNKYTNYNLSIDPFDPEKMIGFNTEVNKHVMTLTLLNHFFTLYAQNGTATVKAAGGIEQEMPAEDFFEIAGVEEAAHSLFVSEKGTSRMPTPPNENPPPELVLDYLSNDMEKSGLVW